jgi:hypothetical protein
MRLVHALKASILVCLIVFANVLFAQTTNGNGTNWLTGANWVGGTAPGAYAAGTPNTLSFTNQNIFVNHDMIVGEFGTTTNMNFANSNFAGQLNIGDNATYIVYGSMNFVNKAMDLVIGDNSTMIVLGDFDLGNQIIIATSGRLVVSGDFNKGGASTQGSFSGDGVVYAASYSGSSDAWLPGDVATGGDQQQIIDDLIDDGFQEIWDFVNGGGEIPLPVELVTFSSETGNQGLVLTWHTASELNNDYFDIERSENGNMFYSIGRVNGHGTKSDPTSYTFTDMQPVAAVSYYRLKQVDFDGTFEYSKVITGYADKLASRLDLSVFPNPIVNQQVTLRGNQQLQFSRIELLAITGQRIIDLTSIHQENAIQTEITLPTLEKGIYYLAYELVTGERGSQKLVVK